MVETKRTSPPAATAGELAAAREEQASLMGLLALSMAMIRAGDEKRILHLAATSIGTLSDCQIEAVLIDGDWRSFGNAAHEAGHRGPLQRQIALLAPDGGAVEIVGAGWGWAYSLHSRGGPAGYLIVGADTRPQEYQQFLLQTLAQQTSVALASARLQLRARVFAQELLASNRALRFSMDVHDRFAEAAWAEAGQDGIAQAVHELTGYSVAVEDGHGNLRAWAGPDPPKNYPKDPPGQRERLLVDLERARTPVRHRDRLMLLARPATGVVGLLALIDPDRAAGPTDVMILEHARAVLAQELIRLQRLAESQQKLAAAMLTAILDAAGDDVVLDRGQALGYDLQRPHRIMIVTDGNRTVDGETVLDAVRQAAREYRIGSVALAHVDSVVLLCDSETNWEAFGSSLRSTLRDGFRIGVGRRRDRWQDLDRSYQEARLALKLQDAASVQDKIVSFEDLGIYQVLGQVENVGVIEELIDRWLGPFLENPANHSLSLVETLRAYLECGGNYDATAHSLMIHRSTLRYRLQKIKDISGYNLADPNTRFNLQLATRAWSILEALGKP